MSNIKWLNSLMATPYFLLAGCAIGGRGSRRDSGCQGRVTRQRLVSGTGSLPACDNPVPDMKTELLIPILTCRGLPF